MEALVAITILGMFIPAVVAFTGYGAIWKFLCLLFCALALVAVTATAGNLLFGLVPWAIAWIFAAVARAGRRQQVQSTPAAFEPDGVVAGVPYRLVDGSVEAIMQGTPVRFRNVEHLRTALAQR